MALVEKSSKPKANTASHRAAGTNPKLKAVAFANIFMPTMQVTIPPRIKGRRRPKELVQRSESTPTNGATIKPDRGPIIHTR